MKAVKIQADGSVKLPSEIRRRFASRSDLPVWTERDTIVLKQLRPVRATEVAERTPAPAMPLAAIAAEVHRMRRTRRGRGA